MKVSAMIRWAGQAAIVGGVFMVFSDLLGLTIYVPGLGEAAHTGYQAVGSGVILLALVLLLVGMVGLHAGQSEPSGARVLESGPGYPRREGSEPLDEGADPGKRLLVDRSVSRSRHEDAGRGHRVSSVPLARSRRHDGEARRGWTGH